MRKAHVGIHVRVGEEDNYMGVKLVEGVVGLAMSM